MSQFHSSTLPDLSSTFVDEGYLKLVQIIGSGGFAKVYKAIDTTSPDDGAPDYYAVKCMRFAPRESRRILERELRTHLTVKHEEGVVRLHRLFREGDLIFMVLDWCPGGDLFDAIYTDFKFEDRPSLIRETFINILDAVAQCHARGVYHRDIKPDNILLRSRREGGVQLADFGLATLEEVVTQERCGSMSYVTPECADFDGPSYRPRDSDLWACVLVLFNLVTAVRPWGAPSLSDPDYASFRTNPETYLRERYQLTPVANDFFRWCFAEDPNARPTLSQMREAVEDIESFTFMRRLPRLTAQSTVSFTMSGSALSLSAVASNSPTAHQPASYCLLDDDPMGDTCILAPPSLAPIRLWVNILPSATAKNRRRRKDLGLRVKLLQRIAWRRDRAERGSSKEN
ncbi:kinase-like domain-containing protein [Roridomyces roridus]|uniref:non-specific serine/threonine protein kinase n=1 Tax=Roridomyces roridus TaxID=1738132 RepID=A0AAD7FCV8_9AGAR|nr:kinase-like domain-containing protein [Roridomyces roridus]